MTPAEAEKVLGMAEDKIKNATDLIVAVRRQAPIGSTIHKAAIRLEEQAHELRRDFFYPRLHLHQHGWGEKEPFMDSNGKVMPGL